MIRRLLLALAFAAVAAPAAAQVQLGRTSIGSTPRSTNPNCTGLRVTTPSDPATGFSLFAYIEDTVGAGDNWRAALIQDADKTTVLAASTVRTDVSTAGWYEFNGGDFSTYNPASAETVVIVVCSDSAAGAGTYQDGTTALGTGYTMGSNPTSVSPTLVLGSALLSDAARDYSIYLQYTVAGGGGGATSGNLVTLGVGQ